MDILHPFSKNKNYENTRNPPSNPFRQMIMSMGTAGKELGVSAISIWKAIQRLKKDGAVIES